MRIAVALFYENSKDGLVELVWEWAVLISPFFLWVTSLQLCGHERSEREI